MRANKAHLRIVDLQRHEVQHTLAAKSATIDVVAQEKILVRGDRTGLVNHIQHVIELAMQVSKHCKSARARMVSREILAEGKGGSEAYPSKERSDLSSLAQRA